MPARLLFGTIGQHVISEDPAASTATAGTANVRLHLKAPFIPVIRNRDSFTFSVRVAIEATDVDDKRTARELVLTQLNREFEDLVFEQTSGTRRISMQISTAEVVKWTAALVEVDGHLATVIDITFTGILRAASGGGGTDPILNPPGLVNEIVWDHYQGPEGRANWTITAFFVNDGSSTAFALANEWAAAFDAARPTFFDAKYERVEKRVTFNGVTGETRINLIYSIPSLVQNEGTGLAETPEDVVFADYNIQVAPNENVDVAVSENPKLVAITGFVLIKSDDDTTFDPDDPAGVDQRTAATKVQEAIDVLKSRALQANGISEGDVQEFSRTSTQGESGARATFQLMLLIDSSGFLRASQTVRRISRDRAVIIPDDSGRDWIYPPAQGVRITAVQTISLVSINDQPNPFPKLAGFRLIDEDEADPVVRNFVRPDPSGFFLFTTRIVQREIVRSYIKVNEGGAGGIGFDPQLSEPEDSGLLA